ncbi:hypothetical protein AA14337_3030 [Acetobacter malorum DSM 14337]|uniref:Phage protein n=1 Tax=Acetobacter malorum DSM 14337 TaxID=1307910 RepID=A0ABQ0PZ88_9PROT|nr:hypothetical protein [Acetobacter malorum]KXV05623.1 hypothetical protein AD930_10805 [Acetobacter malorum]GBQ85277.1 hypothetical protein AA14337_3030 [Acetobacter malorum DSM 14337]
MTRSREEIETELQRTLVKGVRGPEAAWAAATRLYDEIRDKAVEEHIQAETACAGRVAETIDGRDARRYRTLRQLRKNVEGNTLAIVSLPDVMILTEEDADSEVDALENSVQLETEGRESV